MIVSIHQPHFLPWMGYFNKVINSDVFVWLNSVQYRKNYFQNRTRIKSIAGNPIWLTLPVHNHLGDLIADITIADKGWKSRVKSIIHLNYAKTPFYSIYCDEIYSTMEQNESELLSEVNFNLFLKVLTLLDIHTRIVRVEELKISCADPTGRLVEICRKLNAASYIAGKGGSDYMDQSLFEREGIGIFWQKFDPQVVKYSQIGADFVPGLSIIDSLFNIGASEVKKMLTLSWKIPDINEHTSFPGEKTNV